MVFEWFSIKKWFSSSKGCTGQCHCPFFVERININKKATVKIVLYLMLITTFSMALYFLQATACILKTETYCEQEFICFQEEIINVPKTGTVLTLTLPWPPLTSCLDALEALKHHHYLKMCYFPLLKSVSGLISRQ